VISLDSFFVQAVQTIDNYAHALSIGF